MEAVPTGDCSWPTSTAWPCCLAPAAVSFAQIAGEESDPCEPPVASICQGVEALPSFAHSELAPNGALALPRTEAPAQAGPDACFRVEARAQPHPPAPRSPPPGRSIPRARALRRKAGVRISAVPSSSSLALSPRSARQPGATASSTQRDATGVECEPFAYARPTWSVPDGAPSYRRQARPVRTDVWPLSVSIVVESGASRVGGVARGDRGRWRGNGHGCSPAAATLGSRPVHDVSPSSGCAPHSLDGTWLALSSV